MSAEVLRSRPGSSGSNRKQGGLLTCRWHGCVAWAHWFYECVDISCSFIFTLVYQSNSKILSTYDMYIYMHISLSYIYIYNYYYYHYYYYYYYYYYRFMRPYPAIRWPPSYLGPELNLEYAGEIHVEVSWDFGWIESGRLVDTYRNTCGNDDAAAYSKCYDYH